jgi:hypothetical protein
MLLFSWVSFEFVLFVFRGTDEQSNTIKDKIRQTTKALICKEEHAIVVNECHNASS